MIERYTNEVMGSIWSEQNEWDTLKQVEILASEAQAELGNIPKEAAEQIREKAAFSVDRIHEIEAETHHDIAAFVSNLSENIGEAGKYVHLGLTSTDVKDTALGYMLKQASEILLADLEAFRDVLRRRAVEFKYTPTIGRTHGIHAEATTFGLKLCMWLAETERNIERMKRAKEVVSVGKISGAVGTYADVDPFVEEYVCKKLGITPSPFLHRHCNVIVMPNSLRPWLLLPAPSISLQRKFVTYRERKYVKLKNTLAPNKKDHPLCPISGILLRVNACVGWLALFAAMHRLPWKM